MATQKKGKQNDELSKLTSGEIIDSFAKFTPVSHTSTLEEVKNHTKKVVKKLIEVYGKEYEIICIIQDETYKPPYSIEYKLDKK